MPPRYYDYDEIAPMLFLQTYSNAPIVSLVATGDLFSQLKNVFVILWNEKNI